MSAALEAARSYVARGWNPLPLPFKSKIPVDDGWPLRVIREHDLPRFFDGKPQNVGVVLGPSSNGLTDVDLDCREAIELASQVLQKTGAIFGRKSAPASHRLYRSSLASTLGKATISFRDPTRSAGEMTLLEVRVGGEKGAQTVFPGSVHETDEEIRWYEAGDEVEISGDDLLKQARLLASACLLARYWPGEGARHDAALSVGGFLARAGLPAPQIKYLVEAIARTAGDAEYQDRKDAAEDAAQAFYAGKSARGFPLLGRTFGKEVATQVAEWLEYSGSAGDDTAPGNTAEAVAEPVDLWNKFDPPTLPRGVLPDVIERFAFDRGMTMGCDMAGIAVGALAVCAAAIPDSIELQPKKYDPQWCESARIWVALVGPVSAMKSPITKAVTRPLSRIDSEMACENAEAMNEWLKLPKVERMKTPKPKRPRAMLMNATVEATQDILMASPDGLLMYRDELSGWFGSIDRYSGATGAASSDRAFWLESYNGGSYTVSRVIRGNFNIPNNSVSILGGIQPDLIRGVAEGGYDDGLLQRFIPIMLRPAVDDRDEEPDQSAFDYDDLIDNLRDLKPRMTEGLLRTAIPLKFDDGAMAIRKELGRKHLNLAKVEGINRKLASHFGKYNGIFARLCVVWHCVEHAGGELPAVIPEATARRVADFLHGFLLKHALSFYVGVLGLSNDHDRLANIAGYILAHKSTRLSTRDIQRGDRSMRNLKRHETDAIFDQLEALGWVTKAPGARFSAPPVWVVNPVVHQKFAERAEAEKKRREQDRAMIAELMKGGKP